jgi:uncharacterized small protein (DUF1192 family)
LKFGRDLISAGIKADDASVRQIAEYIRWLQTEIERALTQMEKQQKEGD